MLVLPRGTPRGGGLRGASKRGHGGHPPLVLTHFSQRYDDDLDRVPIPSRYDDLRLAAVPGAIDRRYMPSRARRTASTAAAGPLTLTWAAPWRPNR